jgi:Glycosyltransferase family 87
LKFYSPLNQTGLLGNRRIALILWFGLSFLAVIQQIWLHHINNFIVFRSVYFHLVEGKNLYLFYPLEYEDVNLYGPLFGVLVAPFAWLPVNLGVFSWVMANVFFLYWAISRLPIPAFFQTLLIFLCSQELMNSSSWLQSNALICGCILLGYSFSRSGKERWALLFITLAAFIKLYGIIGLAFLPFSSNRRKFILWAVIWAVILFIVPLLFTSWHFLIQSYGDWYTGLVNKGLKNISLTNHNFYQDISVMGLIRRNLYCNLKDIYVIIPGILLYLSQFIYFKKYRDIEYQLLLLCSSLIFVVIFSTGSESSTYLIAAPGMVLWYFLQPFKKPTTWFFSIAFLFTTLCYSDLFTPAFRTNFIMPYSLKAIFPAIIWVVILVQVHFPAASNDSRNLLWVTNSPS